MRRKIIAIVLMLTVLLSACVPQKTEEKEEGKVFNLGGIELMPKGVDPAQEYNGWYMVQSGVTECLFKLDENFKMQPWLAESYKNVDPYTWEITLREGIKFSDGKPLTGEIVAKNLKRIGQINQRAESLKEIEIEVEGNVLTIKTKDPRPAFISDLVDPYASIVNIDAMESEEGKLVATGPYCLTKLEEKKQMILSPNKNYWNGSPKLDKVIIKNILDKETGGLALKKGEVDAFMQLNPVSYKQLEQDENFVCTSIPTSRAFAMYYNLETMADVNLRKAIHLALDKESIAKDLLEGSMTPANGIFPDSLDFGDHKIHSEKYNFEAAQKLLKDSGYIDTDGDGYLEKDGKVIDLSIHFYKKLALEDLATELQATLEKLGIKSEVYTHDSIEYLKEKDFDIGFYSAVTATTSDPGAYLKRVTEKDGVENFNSFSNEKVDALIKELDGTYDVEKRGEIAIKIQQEMLDTYSHEYFGFNNLNSVRAKEVKNFNPSATEYYQIDVNLDIE